MRADIAPGGTFPDYELTDQPHLIRAAVTSLLLARRRCATQ
jgi:hypothetical protein